MWESNQTEAITLCLNSNVEYWTMRSRSFAEIVFTERPGGKVKDFFISYNKADRTWAEWIAWQLEEAGFTVVIQAWDFRPGGNFVLDMQKASAETERVIAVLSPDYLASRFTQPEWAVAFAKDPMSRNGALLPVRVHE